MELPINFDLYEPNEINRNFLRGIKKAYINSLYIDDQSFGQTFIYTQFYQSILENILIRKIKLVEDK